jgi:hypothetical protein
MTPGARGEGTAVYDEQVRRLTDRIESGDAASIRSLLGGSPFGKVSCATIYLLPSLHNEAPPMTIQADRAGRM